MRKIALTAVALLVLTGCATTAPDVVPEEPTAPIDTADTMAFCEKFVDSLSDYASFLGDISTADINESVYKIQLSRMEAMEEVAPADAQGMLEQYADPIYQIKEVVEAGGGELTINTNAYKTANVELIAYCADAGYSGS